MCRGMHNQPIGTDCREKFDDRDWCSLEPIPVDALWRGGNLCCVEISDQRDALATCRSMTVSGLWGTMYRENHRVTLNL